MRKLCPLILLLWLGLPAWSASKAKPFNKKYKNERLEVVLNDLCKRNGYTLSIVDPIDLNKRITANFNDARTSTVLKKVLDDDVQGKVKKGVLIITRKPTPPIVYTSNDTTYTITCQWTTLTDTLGYREIIIPSTDKRKLHNLQVLIGGGYGSMGYQLCEAGQQAGGWAGNLQVRYLYYFTENWGIGLGAGLSTYSSQGILNTTILFDRSDQTISQLQDTEGEAYVHAVRTNNWNERQQAYMADIPLLVQYTYPFEQTKLEHGAVKLYADVGVNLGLCFQANRQLMGGSIEHMGQYEAWNLHLEQIGKHDFYSEQAEAFGTDKQKLDMRLPAVGLMTDVGVALPVAANIDILIGIYANYTVNNVCGSTHDLGWRQDQYMGEQAYRNHEFMAYYDGLIGSPFATSLHPWQAGLRVGMNWHKGAPGEKRMTPELAYRREHRCDTTYVVKPPVETIPEPLPAVVEQIKRTLDKSVIWFDVNSTVPNLQPADILEQVAAILMENPEQQILITGHASREGNQQANERLAATRAQVIADRLIQLGVHADQIAHRGMGVEVDYQQGDHDASLDRRVEIVPIKNDHP